MPRLNANASKLSQSAADSTDMESNYNDPKKFQQKLVDDGTLETRRKLALSYRSTHRRGIKSGRTTLKIAEKDRDSDEDERAPPNLVIQPMSVANNTYEPAKVKTEEDVAPQIEK